MSRGPGVVQRQCLEVLRAAGGVPTDSVEIAARALGRTTITPSENASFRRALRQLARSGSVIDMGRGYRDGRRRWALPAAAAAEYRKLAGMYGERFVPAQNRHLLRGGGEAP